MLQAMLMWLVAGLSRGRPGSFLRQSILNFLGGQRNTGTGSQVIRFTPFCFILSVLPTTLHLYAEGQSNPGDLLKAALFFLEISQNCIAKDMYIVSVSKRLMCMLNDVRCRHAVFV